MKSVDIKIIKLPTKFSYIFHLVLLCVCLHTLNCGALQPSAGGPYAKLFVVTCSSIVAGAHQGHGETYVFSHNF